VVPIPYQKILKLNQIPPPFRQIGTGVFSKRFLEADWKFTWMVS